MTNKYINLIAVEELFNQEKSSIHNDESLDYSTKRILTNELDRVWHYILQIPVKRISPKETGNWKFYGTDNGHNSLYECSKCGHVIMKIGELPKHCENCGIEMKGVNNENIN